jgi:hypothetical protein
MISLFLAIAKDLTSLLDFFRRSDRDSRDRAAVFFSDVADALEKAAERIETGQPGKAVCRELAVYAEQLESIVGDRVFGGGTETAEEMRARLAGLLDQAVVMYSMPESWHETAGDPQAQRQWWREHNAQQRVFAASHRLHYSDHERERALEALMERELDRGEHPTVDVQEIWDAAGEFRGLANAIRAS